MEAVETTNPWTHLNVNNDPANFQFAVVADRNGGGRHDVFRDAVRKLNLLQPEFVMSVGDFIPGYTTNVLEIKAQWKEFQNDIAKLEMPFFCVPGNHDLTNPVEQGEWEKLIGRKFYHFVYHDVLFLCLNTQDPARSIGAEQMEYFRKALEKNRNVRWTMVFMHQPLFLVGPNEKEIGEDWLAFEQMLQGRKYTVLAGHLHHYTKYERLGQKYILLATTGGGSGLRGVEDCGEFDHVMWVTMSDQGPRIANLLLNGIYDENVRTEEMTQLVGPALKQGIETQNVFLDLDGRETARTRIRLTNDADIPMRVRLEFLPKSGVEVSKKLIETVVAPKKVSFADVQLRLKRGAALSDPGPLSFKWTMTFVEPGAGKPKVELNGIKQIGIEPLVCVKRTKPVMVDGNLGEWGTLPCAWQLEPIARPDTKIWSGASDSSFRFATRYDAAFLYIAVNVRDDRIVTNPDRDTWAQDCLEIRLDARADPSRSKGVGKNEGHDIIIISAVPGESPGQPRIFEPDLLPPGSRVAMARVPGGYTAEVAIPISYLDQKQGKPWRAFRLNVAVDDYDDPESRDFVFLSWRPDWRGGDNYEGSGTFVRK